MIAIDTNVLVRFLTQDDEAQCRKIDRLFEKSKRSGELVFVPDLVIVETIWVLESAYKLKKAEVVEAVGKVLLAAFLEFEDLSILLRAQTLYLAGKADFSDYYIQCRAQKAGCSQLFTFDRALVHDSSFSKSP